LEDTQAGLFFRAAWISSSQLAVLTTLGKIMLFQQTGKAIVPDRVLSTSDSTQYMCIAAHNGCLVAGDSEGCVFFLSPEFQVSLRHTISEVPVKMIGVATNIAAVHAADCQAFVITHQRGTAPEGLRVSSIPMNAVVVAVSDVKDLAAFCMPGGRLIVTNFKGTTSKLDEMPGVSAMAFTPDGTGFGLSESGGHSPSFTYLPRKIGQWPLESTHGQFSFQRHHAWHFSMGLRGWSPTPGRERS
jgi:hypothetical protein